MLTALRPVLISLTLAMAFGGLSACGSDDSESSTDGSGGTDATGGSGGSATPAGGAGGSTAVGGSGGSGTAGSAGAPTGGPDAFTGDCSTANWGGQSDACWSCLCGACADTLNACDSDCMAALTCGFAAECMVDTLSEIPCEIQCVANECLQTPEAQAAAQGVVNFDACLIGGGSASGGFRACEQECEIPYPGDVCDRFPAP